jgi:hypothetical protein
LLITKQLIGIQKIQFLILLVGKHPKLLCLKLHKIQW